MSEYSYGWALRGTLKGRDGKRHAVRSAEGQKRAFEGHKQSAHGGQFLESCPACREMRRNTGSITLSA